MFAIMRSPLILLHGERPSAGGLILTYTVAIFAALVVVVRPAARPSLFLWWEIAIAALVAADLAGGVVANFTESTNHFYARKKRLRVIYLLLHLLYPLVLFFVMNGPVEIWAAIPLFTVAGALLVTALPPPVQPPVAAAVVAVGLMVAFSWHVITPPLVWFAPLFLVKLVLGFSVQRPAAPVEPEVNQPAAK
jgi:hypothetical protein